MYNWPRAIVACMVMSASVDVHAAQIPPAPENPPRAQTSLGFNPKARCPDLLMTDTGPMAVVVFWLPRSGIPSHLSLKSSSGSNVLDSATINCVARLRFAAATTLGDGDPIDSWQQIAFTWAGRPSEPSPGAPAATTANGIPDASGGHANQVTVRVCVDEAGKLKQDPTIIRSSGVASVDQAAIKIAASGSAYYRPDTPPGGSSPSGCAQLEIAFDMNTSTANSRTN